MTQAAGMSAELLAATAVSLHLLVEGFPLKRKKNGKDRKISRGKKEIKKERTKPDARYLRTRVFCIGLDSEKQILSWTLNLRLFPENVSSCPSDRAVSEGCGGWQKALSKKETPACKVRLGPGRCSCHVQLCSPLAEAAHLPTTGCPAGKRGSPYLFVSFPSSGALRINLFTF